jgi:drug/metabolite transporter (DMT)-like permease
MLLKNFINSGWLHALFIGLIGYPLGGMSQKFLVSYTDGNILVYTVFLMLSSSIVLLLVAGPGELASRTIKRPETWLYGLTQIGSYVFALLIFQYVSASEGAALGKIAIVVILILSMLFLNQKTNRYELLGSAIILFGLYLIMDSLNLSTEAKAIVIAFVISRALVQGGQKIIAEVHKTNRKANSFKSQIRVTGFIMAVTSFIFFLFLLIMSYIKQNNDISFLKTFPNFNEYADMQVFLFAALLGLVIVSVCKYCEFFASKSIGAKYLAAITSLELVAIYIMENILSNLGLIAPKVIDSTIITALILVIIGSILISIAGFIKDFSFIKKGEKQDTLANLDDMMKDADALMFENKNLKGVNR